MARLYGASLPLETKARNDEWEVSGYLSTFNSVDSVGDVILPTAFNRTLASGRKVKFLFGHDDLQVLGPPLDLQTDEVGLFARGRILKTPVGEYVHTLLKAGALDSWSIGYLPAPDGVDFREDASGQLVRVLRVIDPLFEGSIVAIPANDQAVVTDVKAADVETAEPLADGKPFPNEHACRLRDPDDFQDGSFRRVNRESDGKRYSVIMGRLKGESTMTQQAFRYPKDVWSAAEARSHCRGHDGISFEPASESRAQGGCLCDGGHGLSYDEHAAQVARAVHELVTRSATGVEQRQAAGRDLSAERIAAMARLSGSLHEAHAALDALTVPAVSTVATEWALQRSRLRLAGVEV